MVEKEDLCASPRGWLGWITVEMNFEVLLFGNGVVGFVVGFCFGFL